MASCAAGASMAPLEAKIEERRLKLLQLKARQQLIENRRRYVAAKQVRCADTRRRILIGAAILAKIERKEFDAKENCARCLDEALTREDDRALFGLNGR